MPPIITVEEEGSLCNPTFKVIGDGTTGGDVSGSRCPSMFGGCPADATKGSCTFLLFGAPFNSVGGPDTPVTIMVSAPGFSSAIVHGVHSGSGGCASGPPASDSTAVLVPLALDAGTTD